MTPIQAVLFVLGLNVVVYTVAMTLSIPNFYKKWVKADFAYLPEKKLAEFLGQMRDELWFPGILILIVESLATFVLGVRFAIPPLKSGWLLCWTFGLGGGLTLWFYYGYLKPQIQWISDYRSAVFAMENGKRIKGWWIGQGKCKWLDSNLIWPRPGWVFKSGVQIHETIAVNDMRRRLEVQLFLENLDPDRKPIVFESVCQSLWTDCRDFLRSDPIRLMILNRKVGDPEPEATINRWIQDREKQVKVKIGTTINFITAERLTPSPAEPVTAESG